MASREVVVLSFFCFNKCQPRALRDCTMSKVPARSNVVRAERIRGAELSARHEKQRISRNVK